LSNFSYQLKLLCKLVGSSYSTSRITSMITHPVSEKLSKQNHVTWKAQVVVTTGAHLEGYLTGKIIKPVIELDDKEIKVTNPDYEDWLAANQQILNLLLASVPKDVLIQIATKKTAAVA
jgi:hypothetical protein